MNAFIPQNPRAVVQLNDDGDVVNKASNIGPEFQVEVVYTEVSFNALVQGLPFDSRVPQAVSQVLAHGKH